ncbi:MAG TPA: HAMP domain-containing sensor histidine kinase [Acidimicrobiia bacterium]|nr:HAMP domain-containing sensor histidine kinase [Acidimicrobiia bacterium]
MSSRSGPGTGLGLRGRIAVRFAAIALLLSVLLGTLTYFTVQRLILDDRHASSIEQATGDGSVIAATLDAAAVNPSELLASIRPPSRSTPMLYRDGEWFAASLQVRPEDLPQDLIQHVLDGGAGRQVVYIGERVVSVVGIDLGEDRGAYFEVFSLVDVDNTLTTLARVLFLAGVVTTLAGAVLGALMAKRVLQPLREVTEVAEDIAGGDLERRLDESLDKDLAGLTGSFNSMADTLQDRIAKEARFASDVAHELRTPLTTLTTSLSVLEGRQDELSPQGREALELLSSDVHRLEQTAADLIEIAQHDAGVAVPDLEPIPVASLIGRLLSRLRRSDIAVDIDAGASAALVVADERLMARILANLIENADVHGGGVTRLRISRHGDMVRLGVEDAGSGVPSEERDRIFERFARGAATAGSSDSSGSGLGLALAAENVRLQGGSLWVEDSSSGGARFVVELEVGS